MATPETFWELFKATGSISAYLIYKKLESNNNNTSATSLTTVTSNSNAS